MKINLSKNKHLLTWISHTSLLLAGLTSQNFGYLAFETIQKQINADTGFHSNNFYLATKQVASFISWGTPEERERIWAFLLNPKKAQNLKKLLCRIALRHYDDEYQTMVSRENKGIHSYTTDLIRSFFFYVNTTQYTEDLHLRLLWGLTNLFDKEYNLEEISHVIEAFILDLSEKDMIPLHLEFSKERLAKGNDTPLCFPKYCLFDVFYNQWKFIEEHSDTLCYKKWLSENTAGEWSLKKNKFKDAIKKEKFSNIFSQLIGHNLLAKERFIQDIQDSFEDDKDKSWSYYYYKSMEEELEDEIAKKVNRLSRKQQKEFYWEEREADLNKKKPVKVLLPGERIEFNFEDIQLLPVPNTPIDKESIKKFLERHQKSGNALEQGEEKV